MNTIFCALCFFQTPEELEDDSDFEQEDYDTRSRTSVQTEDDQLIAGQSARVSGWLLMHCAETLGKGVASLKSHFLFLHLMTSTHVTWYTHIMRARLGYFNKLKAQSIRFSCI